MGSVIVNTLSKAFTKVVYNSAGHFMWNGSNFLTNCIFKLFNRLRTITVYFCEVFPEKKNRTDLNQVKRHYMYFSKIKTLFVSLLYLSFIKPTNVSDNFA